MLSIGVRSGVRATGAALGVALGKKTRQENSEQLLRSTVDLFVKEVGQLKGGLMKAGQMLSIYGEHFLPTEINAALKSLQSQSQPVSFKVMEQKLKKSLPGDLFSRLSLNPTPIGAASLGQVYRGIIASPSEAELLSSPQNSSAHHFSSTAVSSPPKNLEVAIKVQYPGMAGAVDSDLAMLRRLLGVAKWLPEAKEFDDVYAEIRTMLHRETDYTRELKYAQRYRQWLSDDPMITVPRMYPGISTKTVLFMEPIQGHRLDSPRVLRLSLERRNRLALALMRLLFREIFEWRVVQTDPHVGNFLVQLHEDGHPQDTLVLLDFGAVRRFPLSYINPFRSLAYCALHDDHAGLLHYGAQIGFLRENDSHEMTDLFIEILTKAVTPFSEKYAGPCDPDGSYTEEDYDWTHDTLASELSQLARGAVFSFKLRPPPREAIFLDRKLVGTVTLLKILKAKIGPRSLALEYLAPPDSSDPC